MRGARELDASGLVMVSEWEDELAPALASVLGDLSGYPTVTLPTAAAYMSTMKRRLGIPGHQLEQIIFTEEATRRGLAAWSAR